MRTTTSHRRRLLPATLLAMLTLVVGVLTACGSNQKSTADVGSNATMSMPPATSVAASDSTRTASQAALHEAMRALWEQHMEWTYSAIAAFAAGSAGFSATAARLLRNQADIGDAIKPYYGDSAGTALTTLLKAHITGFVTVLQAAKAGDNAAYKKAAAAEYANAAAIADFLAKANPKFWPKTEMRQMMKAHIDQTVVYASDQLGKKYADSITAYGQAEQHMLQMADMLSAGIIGAFPDKFTS